MAGADLAGIDLVVAKILAREEPGLETDEPVFADGDGIERENFSAHEHELHDSRHRQPSACGSRPGFHR